MDLAMLRRQLVDNQPVTLTHRDPRTEALSSYVLFVDDAREIVERLEHAERVEAAARIVLLDCEQDDAGFVTLPADALGDLEKALGDPR